MYFNTSTFIFSQSKERCKSIYSGIVYFLILNNIVFFYIVFFSYISSRTIEILGCAPKGNMKKAGFISHMYMSKECQEKYSYSDSRISTT